MQHLLEPLVVSWGWNRDVGRVSIPGDPEASMAPHPARFVEENEWQGTRDPAAYLSVPAAIRFQAEHDWPRVRAECHELLREARRRIEDLVSGAAHLEGALHLEAICPDSPEWYAQMAAFRLPPCDASALQRRLYDEHRVEVPVIEWNGRQFVRVSVQGYNSAEDVEALVGALRTVLAL